MKPRKGYFVYKYVVSDEIIYIGIARDIVRRVREHARCQGLDSKFEPHVNKAEIYVHRCSTESEMRALETLLIDLHKPILNVSGKTNIPSSLSQTGDSVPWTLYNEEDYMEKKMMPAKNMSTQSSNLRIAYRDKPKIYCSVCGKDLRKKKKKVVVTLHARKDQNSGKHDSIRVHTSCRGGCAYIDKIRGYDQYFYFFLSDLFNPISYLEKLFFIMKLMNEGTLFEDVDELEDLQSLFVKMSPSVLRDADKKEREEAALFNIVI